MGIKAIGRALAHRNFRLFFIGQTLSLVGSWMQQIAMSWLVFQLTGSSFQLGVILFLGQIPCLFLPPLVGVFMDHWNRHRVLMVTQIIAMLQAFALAALALTGTIEVWHIMVLSLVIGVVIAFDMPARHAFTLEMVTDRDDLANAVALSAVMFNGARLIGPALAGALLAFTSAGVCFLVNGVSFLAVLISLGAMRLPAWQKHKRIGALKTGMRDGIVYAWRFAPIRNILLLLSLGGLTGSVISVVLPEFTVSILKGDAHILGWLSSFMGLGALLAGLFLASRQTILGLGEWIGGGVTAMGLGLILLPQTATLPLSLAIMFVTGFGMVVHIAAGNTILQTIADEDKRGRVMSFYTMAIVGVVPVGNLISGGLVSWLGVADALRIMGVAAFLGGLAFCLWIPAFGRALQPVLTRLKILPLPLIED